MRGADLEHEVQFFRQAIETYQRENPDEVLVSDYRRAFSKFPNDCCKSASHMLAVYLLEKGFNDIKYVVGYRGENSHGWLKVKDDIVDITADQFEREERKVIISSEKVSDFHKQFVKQEEFKCDPNKGAKRKSNEVVEFYINKSV